ncbi:MAG: MFS transporter [Verrucomicrobia bacterium]|nr:MFS transporter [Verrucomicrobiota bacterium]MBV8484806.1 MFS transporter [Verrucomicrobiota bacterium]
MSTTSIWTALRNPTFRTLWLASVASGCCVSAHDMAATWVMNTLSPSTLMLSLLSSAASLPFFALTFPAGALADTVDRKKLLIVMHGWLALSAAGLAVFGSLRLLTPLLLLIGVFLLGVGFACNGPIWGSVIPDVVSKEELPSAVTLGGVQMNISGIIGPAIGGLLLPLVGANVIFALNGAAFLVVLMAIARWRKGHIRFRASTESMLESFVGTLRYVRYTRGVQVVLVRALLFSLLISVIPALLPAVGLKALHLTSAHLGILFTSMAVGALLGAIFVVPRAREKFTPNQVTILASLLLIVVYISMAAVRQLETFIVVAALAGLGWTLAGSELWVVAQQAMPGWTRGRLNAAQIMVSQGGIALGGLAWGSLAAFTGFEYTLLLATLLVCYNLAITGPLSLDFIKSLDVEPATPPPLPALAETPDLDDGPIAIVAEITVNQEDRNRFLELARDLRLIYLRNGASSVRLYENLTERSIFRLEAVVMTWREHQLLYRRFTKPEREILDHLLRLHTGTEAPTYHYALITKQILVQK